MMHKRIACGIVLLMVACFAGCTASPEYASKSFEAEQIDRIVVLPFLDNRAQPNPKHDFNAMCAYVTDLFIDALRGRGYFVVQSADIGTGSAYTAQRLPSQAKSSREGGSAPSGVVEAEWVKNLGPASSRWVVVPVFDDLTTTFIGVGWAAKAKISVYLFDKKTGELAWENRGECRDQVGLLGAGIENAALGKDFFKKSTVSAALSRCVNAFPKRPGVGMMKYSAVGHQDLGARSIGTITILPVVDARREIDRDINFEQETSTVPTLLGDALKRKGYESVALTDRAALTLGAQQIPFAEASQIRELGSEQAPWVMVPMMEGLNKVRGDSSRVDFTCYLFDTSAGKLVWEGFAHRKTIPMTIFQEAGLDVRGIVEAVIDKLPAKSRQ